MMLAFFSYGGIERQTHEVMTRELSLHAANPKNEVEIFVSGIDGDALISRSRSKVASDFLRSDAEVLFMLDHDIEFTPGDMAATAKKAIALNALVGGMYPVRAIGRGWAGRAKEDGVPVRLGEDRTIECEFLGAGFLAIPRAALERIRDHHIEGESAVEGLTKCAYLDGTDFYDFFRPIVIESRAYRGKNEYLSEDWAFCERATWAGIKSYAWTKPILYHWGKFSYNMSHASIQPKHQPKVKLA